MAVSRSFIIIVESPFLRRRFLDKRGILKRRLNIISTLILDNRDSINENINLPAKGDTLRGLLEVGIFIIRNIEVPRPENHIIRPN